MKKKLPWAKFDLIEQFFFFYICVEIWQRQSLKYYFCPNKNKTKMRPNNIDFTQTKIK